MKLSNQDIDNIFSYDNKLVYYCEDDNEIAVSSDEVSAYAIQYEDAGKNYIQIYDELQPAKDGYMLLLQIVDKQKNFSKEEDKNTIMQLYTSMSEKISDVAEINPRFIQELNGYKFYNYKGENINIINVKTPEFKKDF